MKQPQKDIADIFRIHFDDFITRYGKQSPEVYKVAKAIMNCRSATLGGHTFECPHCKHTKNVYNSCRNRHCPQCQATKSVTWVENRSKDLLPVPYFHVVFTIPHELNAFALRNRREFYSIHFKAISQTLTELASNPQRLDGDIGFIALLHTWGHRAKYIIKRKPKALKSLRSRTK